MIHLENLPRAALASEADPSMSEKYVYIDTREVIKLMGKEGWQVASAKSSTTRKRDPLFARHMIDFRHPDGKEVNGMAPRVVFVNSHNGTSAAVGMAGYFRFVCSNGLIVGTKDAEIRSRHIHRDAREFVHEMQKLAKVAENKRKQIDRWAGIELTKAQRDEYARLTAQLRWGDAYAFETVELLRPRREEDDKGDLLSTFNILQENTSRGGVHGLSRNGRRLLSQPISDIGRDTKFNALLWDMTSEFAEAVAG